MKTKNIVILFCVAAVLVFIAVRTGSNRIPARPAEYEIRTAFENLPLNDITRLIITDAAGEIEVERTEAGWRVPAAFGYPASFDTIQEALLTLSRIKAGEPRSLNAEQRTNAKLFSPLDSSAPGPGRGTLVEAFTSDDEPVASLLIGSQRSTQGAATMAAGKFISLDGGNTALITPQLTGQLEVTDLKAWLDTEMISIDAAGITNISISVQGEKPLVLSKNEAGQFTLDKLARREIMDEIKTRSVSYVLSYLRFDEVANPALDNSEMGFDKPSVYKAATDKGELYTLTIGGTADNSGRRYVRLSAEFTGAAPQEPEPAGDGEAAPEPVSDIAEAAQRVKKINWRAEWSYILAEPKVAAALYSRSDLVTKEKK